MKIIKTIELVHEFLVRNEAGKVESVNRSLDGVTMEIEKGSFVVLLGHNGSGKSTLARHLNALLAPTSGTVVVDGASTSDESALLGIRKTAGMIFQNPDNQIIASVVEEDVAFGPENLGIPSDEIWQRVTDSLESVGMTAYREHSPNKLSGGQKQRVAIAGVMAMRPQCMILDEATAMLDPSGRKEVMAAVHELNKKAGVTIIHITHDMDEAIGADRVIVMDHGHVVMDDVPEKIFARMEELQALSLTVPQITELAWKLRQAGMPVDEAVLHQGDLLRQISDAFVKTEQSRQISGAGNASQPGQMENAIGNATQTAQMANTVGNTNQAARMVDTAGNTNQDVRKDDALLTFDKVSYTYGKSLAFEVTALNDINLKIEKGSFVGLIGHTGSGKSTLLQHMNGLLVPHKGRVYYKEQDINGEHFNRKRLCSKVGLVFQYPEYQLFEETIIKDVAFGPKNLGCSEEEAMEKAKEALAIVGIPEEEFHKSPFELSGGQKRRVAIAGILAMNPEILVIDEPAAGLDPLGKQELLDMIEDLHKNKGITVVLSSHSMEDMAKYAQRILVMNAGSIVLDGTPEEIFSKREYLESIGLSAPEVVYFMDKLGEMGIHTAPGILTIDGAARAIVEQWQKSRKVEPMNNDSIDAGLKSDNGNKTIGEVQS